MQMEPSGGNVVETASSNGHHATNAYGPSGRSPWLDVDWREHQRWVSVLGGQPVNTIDLGEGPPLVFVHGLSGSWPNWLEQLPVFAEDHRVIAMDLPGFGHSPMPHERITISGYARLLDGLFDELGIGAATLVGNSMGGFISAELAIAFPEHVEGLVLVSPAGISSYRNARGTRALPALHRAERIVAAYTAWMASKSDAVTNRPLLRNATLGFVTRHPTRLPAALAAEQLRGAGKPGFIQALEANLDYDFRDRLPEIACPTLIVWGDQDKVLTVRDAAVYAELIPGSRKVVYPDTGHMSQIERPDAFNALLRDFLGE
ncbi:MAG TPA: alpha/beta hydrolase [Solirubrobacteraceae bacterium]|jgi:pimeloyl-ACP methyl ester carboxylesterase